MGKTKDITARHKILNDLFRRGSYTLAELHHKVNANLQAVHGADASVSIRTVQKDIEQMRSEDAPVVYSNGRYKYASQGYDFFNRALSTYETEQILQAAQIIKQLKCFDHHEELISIYNKLENRIAMNGEFDEEFIQFDTKSEAKGTTYIPDLIDSIKHHNVISFEYKAFVATEPHKVVLHPYLLREYNSRWFIIGRDGFADKIFTYALDRICSHIKLSHRSFIPPPANFYRSWYSNIIGVTIPASAKVEKVKLRFTASRAPYIETVKLHSSQAVISRTKNYVVFGFDLIINNELISAILGYGSDAVVLAPVSLKQSISKIVAKMKLML